MILCSGVTGGGGGGQGGRVPPPETSDREIFADVSGKKRQGKKGKWVKIEKKRWKIGNGSRKTSEKEVRTFFFFFFCFSLLKTTKICFGSTKMGIFYREKAFHAGKKNQEKWLCPLRKICLLRPWSCARDASTQTPSSQEQHRTETAWSMILQPSQPSTPSKHHWGQSCNNHLHHSFYLFHVYIAPWEVSCPGLLSRFHHATYEPPKQCVYPCQYVGCTIVERRKEGLPTELGKYFQHFLQFFVTQKW